MVRVQCPHCQRRYRTELEAFGRTAVCTRCAKAFKIGDSRPPFQWKHTDLAEDSWIGVPPPEEKREVKHCIICDAPLRPEMIRCPECGANQVTGVVHKHRAARPTESSAWDWVPIRPILIVLAVAMVGSGVYWGFKLLGRKSQEMGNELADSALMATVARQIREGADEADLAARHAGQVNDENLVRFMAGLPAESPHTRRAAILLIGSGRATRLDPLVSAARGSDARTAESAFEALAAIGPRRLVQLSCDADPAVRASAAEAVRLLFDLKASDAKVAQLTEPMTPDEKLDLLNEICRYWPYLNGTFAAEINGSVSPMTLTIVQAGKVFVMRVGAVEFSTKGDSRRFEIPIDRWCAATGPAVDRKSVRELLGGRIVLEAGAGVEWKGRVELTARRRITGALPGFLPLPTPDMGKSLETEIRLVRPRT